MVKRICYDFGLRAGKIAETGVNINRKFIGCSLLDIIQTLYTIASEKTGKKYVIRFEDNLLCIAERSEEVVLSINGQNNLMSAVTSESAENIVDCVVVYDKDENFINSFKNDENIKLLGLMQRYLKKGDDEDAAEKAKKILEDIKKDGLEDIRLPWHWISFLCSQNLSKRETYKRCTRCEFRDTHKLIT